MVETDDMNMYKIKADIALFPIDRRVSMTHEDTAAIASVIKVKYKISMNYINQ